MFGQSKATGAASTSIPAHFGRFFSKSAPVESGAVADVGKLSVSAGAGAMLAAVAGGGSSAGAQAARLSPTHRNSARHLVVPMEALYLSTVASQSIRRTVATS